ASSREEVEVMIPEGYSCAQIFELLEEKKVCTVEELELCAATGELNDYWFLEGVRRGEKYSLEGYLFPDTYRFYLNDDPENVLGKMLNNFDYRFTDLMKEKIEPLNTRMAAILSSRGYTAEYIDSHKFTIREIVIIASMIEKETANDSESFDISSVIYNRLTNPASYPFLNIDATIIYALGGNIDPETGETRPLTKADLEMDHPYNSYTQKGLIPGPISNPGRASLLAALDPNETNYYFYVYNPNAGVHKFARTPEEHEKNVASVRPTTE
ncbi:MAG: endolytic transglycosylase MltG, partial [Firmicutes bacterium]|nr:endolytic transglycosylase MltG [Bacillota bacterium]